MCINYYIIYFIIFVWTSALYCIFGFFIFWPTTGPLSFPRTFTQLSSFISHRQRIISFAYEYMRARQIAFVRRQWPVAPWLHSSSIQNRFNPRACVCAKAHGESVGAVAIVSNITMASATDAASNYAKFKFWRCHFLHSNRLIPRFEYDSAGNVSQFATYRMLISK